jgi:ubiquinone/menaquinone biosynthesis C-methylase UbiE
MVFGVDPSAPMVRQGRARARDRGVRYVWFERADPGRLSLPDGVFDAALCASGLVDVPDPRHAVAEMARVLCEGGRAAAVVRGARAGRSRADEAMVSAFGAAGFVDITTSPVPSREEPECVIVHGRKAR